MQLISCPAGHFKKSRQQTEVGCSEAGLKCPTPLNPSESYVCLCRPCVRAEEVDVLALKWVCSVMYAPVTYTYVTWHACQLGIKNSNTTMQTRILHVSIYHTRLNINIIMPHGRSTSIQDFNETTMAIVKAGKACQKMSICQQRQQNE